MRLHPILWTALLAGSPAANAAAISITQSTALLDSSTFTEGTPYYLAFQMTSAGNGDNDALLSNFQFDTGFAWTQSVFDPVSGLFAVGPDPLDTTGIGQLNATLALQVTAGNAYSLYSQLITAGTTFSFDVALSANYTPPNAPDAFLFQIYDANFTTLLYEQTLPISAPEPMSFLLVGLALVLARARRARSTPAPTL